MGGVADPEEFEVEADGCRLLLDLVVVVSLIETGGMAESLPDADDESGDGECFLFWLLMEVDVFETEVTPEMVSSSLGRSCSVGSTCMPPLADTVAEEEEIAFDVDAEGGCTMTLFSSFRSRMRVPRVDQLEGL